MFYRQLVMRNENFSRLNFRPRLKRIKKRDFFLEKYSLSIDQGTLTKADLALTKVQISTDQAPCDTRHAVGDGAETRAPAGRGAGPEDRA